METTWYYTQGRSEQQGPVPESEIRTMLEAGTLKRKDLVWREGMAEWTRVSLVPEFMKTGAADAVAPSTAGPVATVPPSLPSWMTFVGVVTLLMGILYCLTCFGLPMGILMAIGGGALLTAGNALRTAGDIDPSLALFFKKLHTFMLMTGIVYILGVVLVAFALLANIAGLFLG